MSYCLFEIDGQLFGVSTQDVIKIVPCIKIIPLPRSSNNVLGLHSFRGGVISVITLEHRLNLKMNHKKDSFLLVMEHKTGLIALLVDLVRSVKSFNEDDFIEMADTLIQAKLNSDSRTILLLNTDALLKLGPE
jgi:purine-binding chemotaxis protein CheW